MSIQIVEAFKFSAIGQYLNNLLLRKHANVNSNLPCLLIGDFSSSGIRINCCTYHSVSTKRIALWINSYSTGLYIKGQFCPCFSGIFAVFYYPPGFKSCFVTLSISVIRMNLEWIRSYFLILSHHQDSCVGSQVIRSSWRPVFSTHSRPCIFRWVCTVRLFKIGIMTNVNSICISCGKIHSSVNTICISGMDVRSFSVLSRNANSIRSVFAAKTAPNVIFRIIRRCFCSFIIRNSNIDCFCDCIDFIPGTVQYGTFGAVQKFYIIWAITHIRAIRHGCVFSPCIKLLSVFP